MASVCPICKNSYTGVACPNCTVTGLDVTGLELQNVESPGATAFLVDLVSNRKIPITTPRCKVGRDDLNDIVISGDQSISRFHFVITKENGQYLVQDGKSRHGTFLNGNQITGPEPIHDGDVLKVGVSLFWFVIEAQVQAAAPDKTSPLDVHAAEPMAESEAKEQMPAAATSSSSSRDDAVAQPPDWVHTLSATDEQSPAATAPATREIEIAMPGSVADLPEMQEAATGNVDSEPTSDSGIESKSSAESSESSPPESSNESAADEISSKDRETEPAEITGASDTEGNESETRESGANESGANHSETADSGTTDTGTTDTGTTDMDYQFSLSEDNITKAADRIHDAYNATDSEPEILKDESTESDSSEKVESKPQETLDKLAEVLNETRAEEAANESSLSSYLAAANSSDREPQNRSGNSSDKHSTEKPYRDSNGAKVIMSMVKESASNATVPDWCKKYFSAEISHLDKELAELEEEVRQRQLKIKDVENRVALTKGLRNILLTTQGDELVDACGKILTMLGWRTKVADEDKLELKMEADDKSVCIARVVWTEKEPDRGHLGQLSISQTRYWCEVGDEPKGILIVARGGDLSSMPLAGDYAHELADYASKKNVCLMSTLQLLSCYKEVFLHDGSPESVRSTIMASSGWLHGFHLEPGSGEEKTERPESTGGGKNTLSSLLSA